MSNKPTADTIADGQIEIWKKVVDVQQHFNDLELRIRNFALAVTGAFLGLGGYAIKDGGFTKLLGLDVSVAGVVVFAAIFPLAAFYFMDRLWYHRLLEGSVAAGIKAESSLKAFGYTCELGTEIKNASPFDMWFFGNRQVRSKHKMDLFYLILFLSLLLVAGVLGFGLPNQQRPTKKSMTTVERVQSGVPSSADLTHSRPLPPGKEVPSSNSGESATIPSNTLDTSQH
jgi:hypothetical protein